MRMRLVTVSGAVLAAAAMATAAAGHAEGPDVVAEPAPPQTQQTDAVQHVGTPAPATQVSSIGTSVGSSMATMAPMMAMMAPMMGLPMLMSGVSGLARSGPLGLPVGPAASAAAVDPAAVNSASVFGGGHDSDLSSVLGQPSELDLSHLLGAAPELDPAALLGPVPDFDPTSLLASMPELDLSSALTPDFDLGSALDLASDPGLLPGADSVGDVAGAVVSGLGL